MNGEQSWATDSTDVSLGMGPEGPMTPVTELDGAASHRNDESASCPSLSEDFTSCTQHSNQMSNPIENIEPLRLAELSRQHMVRQAEISRQHMDRERLRGLARAMNRQARRVLDLDSCLSVPQWSHVEGEEQESSSPSLTQVEGDSNGAEEEAFAINPVEATSVQTWPATDRAKKRSQETTEVDDQLHNTNSLTRLCAHYNSLSARGPISDMVANCKVGYVNVPGSSVFYTSNPVTATFTRRSTCICFMILSLFILNDMVIPLEYFDEDSLTYRAGPGSLVRDNPGRRIKWMRVYDLNVFENVFPDLSQPADAASNGRLKLVDGGVYYKQLDQTGCKTTITSPTSFELLCDEQVPVHGFWVYVSGSSKMREGRPFHEYAGIQYRYQTWDGEGTREDNAQPSAGSGQIKTVMGTDQELRGHWGIAKSLSRFEGLFRVPISAEPLLQQHWHICVYAVSYFAVGLFCFVSGVAGLLGHPRMAKNACVFAAAIGACFNFVPAMDNVLMLLDSDRPDLAKVLVGLHFNVQLDKSDNWALGLNTAILLASTFLLQQFAMFGLALFLWLEKNVLIRIIILAIFGIIAQAVNVELNEALANPIALYSMVLISLFCVVYRAMSLRVQQRIRFLMSQDQAHYDKWWNALNRDPFNRQALCHLCAQVELIQQTILHRHLADHGLDPPLPPHTLDTAHPDDNGAVPSPPPTAQGGQADEALASMVPGDTCKYDAPLTGRGRALIEALLQWVRWLRRGAGCRGEGSSERGIGKQMTAAAIPRIRQMYFPAQPMHKEMLELQHAAEWFKVPFLTTLNQRGGVAAGSERVGGVLGLGGRDAEELSQKRVTSIDTLFQHASCLRPVLQGKIMQYVRETPHASRISSSLETPLKKPERAVQKILRCYGGDCSLLVDICRECIVFDKIEDITQMVEKFRHDPEIQIVRVKNRLDPHYDSKLSAGYRDVMINLKIVTQETVSLNIQHHVAELQLIPRPVFDLRGNDAEGGAGLPHSLHRPLHSYHMNYVLWRNLRGQ